MNETLVGNGNGNGNGDGGGGGGNEGWYQRVWWWHASRSASAVGRLVAQTASPIDAVVVVLLALAIASGAYALLRCVRHAYNATVPFVCTIAVAIGVAALDSLRNLVLFGGFACVASAVWLFVMSVVLAATRQAVAAMTLRDIVRHSIELVHALAAWVVALAAS